MPVVVNAQIVWTLKRNGSRFKYQKPIVRNHIFELSIISENLILERSVISDYQNMNLIKPDIQVIFNNNETCPQFAGGYNTTDEYGNLVMVDNCECERRKVISDPTIGYGEFNIRSGLFLDERLQTPLPVDQGRFHQKCGLL